MATEVRLGPVALPTIHADSPGVCRGGNCVQPGGELEDLSVAELVLEVKLTCQILALELTRSMNS